MTQQVLSVSHVRISAGRMTCFVELTPGFSKYVTPDIMEQVLLRYPTLSRHACVNEKGSSFASVMNNTSLPHVLEHLIIDTQVRAMPHMKRPLVGVTEWIDEVAGKARVSVSFMDDLCALAALNEALSFLNGVLVCQKKDSAAAL